MFSYFNTRKLSPQNLFGFGSKTVNNSKLIGFNYSFSAAPRGDNYSIEIENNIFKYESIFLRDGNKEIKIDSKLLDDLKDLYLKYDVYKWDGFNKYPKNVLDGKSFTIKFKFEDGKSCYASGANAFPKNYKEFKDDMDELFKPILENLNIK